MRLEGGTQGVPPFFFSRKGMPGATGPRTSRTTIKRVTPTPAVRQRS